MAIERELKFRLAPRAATRAVSALALGRAQSFAALYYDTPDEALRRARMALRVRREGGAWLQTLKCEISASARGEWQTTVPRARLDVARLPRAEIRKVSGVDIAALAGRLCPQFQTRFTRRAARIHFDGAIVAAALDRGAIIARRAREPILELELELKHGAPSRLARYAKSLVAPLGLALAVESKAERGYRLAKGGGLAPPRKWQRPPLGPETAAGEALAVLVGAAAAQAAANAQGLLASPDAQYLHQLRVALRRLRATLAAFKELRPQARPLKRRLRSFGPLLGAARDWDVFMVSLPKGTPLMRRARNRRRQARRAAVLLLESPAFHGFLVRALQWIEQSPWQQSPDRLALLAARALERLHRKALKLARRIDWQDAGARHALRIRVKRLRYACDSFAGCFSAWAVEPYLAGLERLQDDFGELNDIAVGRRFLAELGGEAGVEREFARRERQLIARLPRDWETFAGRSLFWRAQS
jgi:inorganic triphosphatase YgiF